MQILNNSSCYTFRYPAGNYCMRIIIWQGVLNHCYFRRFYMFFSYFLQFANIDLTNSYNGWVIIFIHLPQTR